jgi:hypothetical protein
MSGQASRAGAPVNTTTTPSIPDAPSSTHALPGTHGINNIAIAPFDIYDI